MGETFDCHSELHSMKKTSEDSFKKTFFPKFKLLNSGCGLSAGVYGICRSRHRRALQAFAFPLLFDGK